MRPTLSRLGHILCRNTLIVVALVIACPANAAFGHHFSVTPHVYWGNVGQLPSKPSKPAITKPIITKPSWSCNTKNAAVLYPDSCGE